MEIKRSLVMEAEESLSKAVSELMDSGTAVIVTKGKRYYGIVDDRHVRQGIADPKRTKVETVVVKPPTILPSATLFERINAFLLGHFKALPVVDDKGNPLGITTRVETLKEMLDDGLVPKIRVSTLMSSPVYTIEKTESIGKAKRLMKELDARRLLVVNNGMPVGVISTLDLTAYLREPKASDKKPVVIKGLEGSASEPIAKFLRSDFVLIGEQTSVDEAVREMIQRNVSSVVVTSKSTPIGVFSALDLFKKIKEDAQEKIDIRISGLEGENRELYQLIEKRFSAVVEKFSRSFNIRNVHVKAKENKKTFVVKLYLETDERHFSLSQERYDFKACIDEIAKELEMRLRKEKDKRKGKRRRIHGGNEEL